MDDRYTRRQVAGWLVGAGALVACSGDGKTGRTGETGGETGGGTGGSTAFGAWATGGTAAMTGLASYPDPFASGASASTLCEMTIGPCHTTSPQRSDISEGATGLPVQLVLRVVDADGAPLAGVAVEVWHTNFRGGYSGDIQAMCTDDDHPEDADEAFFRGYQITDADGRATFLTCFPGWYSSRAVHIHFRVMTAYDPADGADASLVSQLFFDDALVASIFADEPVYADYGTPDTSITGAFGRLDSIAGAADDPSVYTCDVAQMTDGAMQASKTIRITAPACSV